MILILEGGYSELPDDHILDGIKLLSAINANELPEDVRLRVVSLLDLHLESLELSVTVRNKLNQIQLDMLMKDEKKSATITRIK